MEHGINWTLARIRKTALTFAAAAIGAAVLMGSSCNLTNKAPTVPVISGPRSGVVGVPVTFKATATDPESDSIAFQFDWGDTTTPIWSALIASGETLSVQHTYSDSGTFSVKAKAKDKKGKESAWVFGSSLPITDEGSGYPDSLDVKIWVGGRVVDLAMAPGAQRLYIADNDLGRVLVMRVDDYEIVDTILVGHPHAMAFSPDGQWLYLISQTTDTMLVIRTSDNTLVQKVDIGSPAGAIQVSPDGQRLYVACGVAGIKVVRVQNFSIVASVAVEQPYGLALNSDGSTLYATVSLESSLVVIPTASCSVATVIKLGSYAQGVTVTPNDEYVCVACRDSSLYIVVADSRVIENKVWVGGIPEEVAVLPGSRYALVANHAYDGLPVVDLMARAVVGRLDTDGFLGTVAVTPDGSRVFAADAVVGIYAFVHR